LFLKICLAWHTWHPLKKDLFIKHDGCLPLSYVALILY
jgi:hypothetical protein